MPDGACLGRSCGGLLHPTVLTNRANTPHHLNKRYDRRSYIVRLVVETCLACWRVRVVSTARHTYRECTTGDWLLQYIQSKDKHCPPGKTTVYGSDGVSSTSEAVSPAVIERGGVAIGHGAWIRALPSRRIPTYTPTCVQPVDVGHTSCIPSKPTCKPGIVCPSPVSLYGVAISIHLASSS